LIWHPLTQDLLKFVPGLSGPLRRQRTLTGPGGRRKLAGVEDLSTAHENFFKTNGITQSRIFVIFLIKIIFEL
jgi:hypothetical protein